MTAFTKPTLADLKQSLADRKTSGKLPADSATLSLWIRTFNRAVRYCIEKLRISKSTSLTTTSGTVALPDDFMFIDRIYNSGETEFSQITKEKSVGASGCYYWVTGDSVNGYYLNVPDDDTFTVYYTYKPVKMSADADVCPFPDEEAIVAYAYGMIRKSESDPFEDSGSALAECDNRLKEIGSQELLNNGGNQFSLMHNA
jgi:hypothetical protein